MDLHIIVQRAVQTQIKMSIPSLVISRRLGIRGIQDDGKWEEESSEQLLVCYMDLCKTTILQNWDGSYWFHHIPYW